MTVRRQRYVVIPPSACPLAIQLPGGHPPAEIELDMADVARCALAEMFQTAPHSASTFAFLEDLLAPGTALTWLESGPGRGAEMRRSFSGMFGRFFARAYLQVHHDYSWFSAIDGNSFHLSPSWRVTRKPDAKTEMPDWVCARPGELAIAEAKGSHQSGNALGVTHPGPIKTAAGQIEGVVVQKRLGAGRFNWTNKKVKGWAVMSRWGLTSPPRAPYLFALDPDTDGEPLQPAEAEELVELVARGHVEQLASGLGLLKASEQGFIRTTRLRVRLGDHPGGVYAGVVVSPFGVLNIDVAAARQVAAHLPDPEVVQFLGLEERVLDDYLAGRPISPVKRRALGERTTIGNDGLMLASIKQTVELGTDSATS